MSIVPNQVLRGLERVRALFTEGQLRDRLASRAGQPRIPGFRGDRTASKESIASLWQRMREVHPIDIDDERLLADDSTIEAAARYGANIENMIGTVKIPVGIIGPLRINGIHAHGDFLVPLATTEAALVASYGRGAEIASMVGGISAAVLAEGVLRSPGFKFQNLVEAGLFIDWIVRSSQQLKAVAESTTSHGKLVSIEPMMDNEVVFLLCRYTTGDASGQNMVTIATEAMCRHIEAQCPIKPLHWFVEANFSGDKKSTYLGLITGRGRKVTASVTIPAAVVETGLHTSVEHMLAYGQMANLGAMLSGQLGAQGHYANGLAALYIATGQDAACVSESAIGITRMEPRGPDLFVSVTLPNILVGSVGGGTGLPSQSAALRLMGLHGAGNAAALAEVAAAVSLCGELSIIGALAASEFSQAHRKFARAR